MVRGRKAESEKGSNVYVQVSQDLLDDFGPLDEGDEQVALFANDYRSATSRRAAELRASHAPRRFSR